MNYKFFLFIITIMLALTVPSIITNQLSGEIWRVTPGIIYYVVMAVLWVGLHVLGFTLGLYLISPKFRKATFEFTDEICGESE